MSSPAHSTINSTMLEAQHAASAHRRIDRDIDPLIGSSLPLIWQRAAGFQAARRGPVKTLLNGKPAKYKIDKDPTAILCDDSKVWVATSTPDIRMYNLKSDTCKSMWKHPVKGSKVLCKTLAWVREYIWAGLSDGSIVIFDGNKSPGKVVVVHTLPAARPMSIVDIIALRGTSNIWVVYSDGKVSLYHVPSNLATQLPVLVPSGGLPRPVNCAQRVQCTGFIWVGSATSLDVYQCDDVDISSSIDASTTIVEISSTSLSSKSLEKCSSIVCVNDELVCTGHFPGSRIAFWQSTTMQHVETIDLEGFPVRHIVVPSDSMIWLGAQDGRIRVIDGRNKFVVKDWTAHHDSLVQLHSHGSMVSSVSKQGNIRVYDATLQQDYSEYRVEQAESDYAQTSSIHAFVGSWNIGATSVDPKVDLTSWLSPQSHDQGCAPTLSDLPEVYAIGLQECVELNAKSVAVSSLDGSVAKSWEEAISKSLLQLTGGKKEYTMMFKEQLVGIVLFVFVKMSSVKYIRDIQGTQVKVGLKGLAGNKGAVAVSFMYGNTFVALVNCHLSAGQDKSHMRNQHQQAILAQAKFENGKKARVNGGLTLLDHDAMVFFGDLNFRLDLDYDTCKKHIFERDWACLYSYDQLNAAMSTERSWSGFSEEKLAFAPTHKYDPGTNIYDTSPKKRDPAWCDRILSRGRAVSLTSYRRSELLQSDHRPVSAIAKIVIQTHNDTKKRAIKKQATVDHKARPFWDVNVTHNTLD